MEKECQAGHEESDDSHKGKIEPSREHDDSAFKYHKRQGKIKARSTSVASEQATTTKQTVNLIRRKRKVFIKFE